jgi:hypothetical protein
MDVRAVPSRLPDLPYLADVGAFVAWESRQGRRHEYCAGVVSLVPGGTNRHAEFASAIAGELYIAPRETGVKRDEYFAIETLEEDVLVDSRRRSVTAFRRSGAGWIEDAPVERGLFRFASVDVTVDMDAVYENVGLPAAGDEGASVS